jgi:hypothetical protein
VTPAWRTDLPVRRPVAGHHEPAPFYLTADMFGGLPVEVAGGEVHDLVGRPVADPHRHTVDEVYLLLAPEPGGAEIDVEVEGRSWTLAAPAAFHVPAGSLHRFVTRRAMPGSWCLGILMGSQTSP